MSENKISVSEGAGKNIHSWDRTVSSVLVQQQFVLPGEYPYPTYMVAAGAVSAATTGDHVIQIMAGASNPVAIRRITVYHGNATGSAQLIASFALYRLTTAGTGGTAASVNRFNLSDAAPGATAMTLPSSKGTEGSVLGRWRLITINAVTSTGTAPAPMFEWSQLPNEGPIVIPAGTANGVALKSGGSYTGLTLDINVEIVEIPYL